MSSTSKAAKQSKPPQAAPSKPGHPASPIQTIKQATQGLSEAGPALGADPSVGKDEKKSKIRASKIEYKTVNEVYVLL